MRMSVPATISSRRGEERSQGRIKDRGTEIGECSEFLAQAKQSSFGTKLARVVIEGRTSDGSQ